MRFFRPCFIGGWLYPGSVFRMKTEEKLLCLTFDDGPDPASTPRILEILDKHNVKGIFFCDGRAAEKQQMSLIRSRGHLVGNHGYAHLDGWRCASEIYVDDAEAHFALYSASLRTPEAKPIPVNKANGVFWDLMPYDFDRKFGSEKSLRILETNPARTIIVLHDNPGSSALKFLPEFIDYAIPGYFLGLKT